MDELVVITPSRGRPSQLRELIDACAGTAAGPVRVLPCLDDDDPTLDEYRRVLPSGPRLVGPRKTLSGWTNHAARALLANADPPAYLASLGDDHRPRTPSWDRTLIGAIESLGGPPGFAYGNDLFQGANLCTAWVVSSAIVRALGWMMLPAAEHMCVDNAVLELGRATGRIMYCPNVVIEHLHPLADKASWDPSYRETNADARVRADRDAFNAWRNGGGLAESVAAINALTTPAQLFAEFGEQARQGYHAAGGR